VKAFGADKFRKLLLAGSFTVLLNYLVKFSDVVIVGNLLGEQALAGLNLVSPCFSAITFLANLVATGMATNYSISMGRCDTRRAHAFFVQGLWSVLLLGGLLAAALGFGRDVYLSFMGAAPEATAFARDYLSWVWPLAVVEGLMTLLIAIGYADGDTKLCTSAYGTVFVANLVISVLAVRLGMGIAGCALGTVVACGLGVLVMCCHFLRASNTVRLVRHFRLADIGVIVYSSFGDAMTFLCEGVTVCFVNKFVIGHFGSQWLPVVSVLTACWGLCIVFDALGVALQPIATVYYGEGNTKSLRVVMYAACRAALCEGVALTVLFASFPQVIVRALGVDDPELVSTACAAVRYLSVGFCGFAFCALFNSYYMFIERPGLGALFSLLCYCVGTVACVTVCSAAGVTGVWIGMGAGPAVGMAVSWLCVLAVGGWRRFPFLLSRDRDANLHVFDLVLDEPGIVAVSRAIGEIPGVPMRASLITEEALLVVKERNAGRRVRAEVTVDLNDGVMLTLRDDGRIFDITDADAAVSSLRSYLVASVMGQQAKRMNLVTTGFNRNVFRF